MIAADLCAGKWFDAEKAMVRAAIENGGIDQAHSDFTTILNAIKSKGAGLHASKSRA